MHSAINFFFSSSGVAASLDCTTRFPKPGAGQLSGKACAPVAVGGGEVANRLTAQQEVDQNAFFNQRNALGLDSLIVHVIVAEQSGAFQSGEGRVVGQAQEIRQHACLVAAGKLPTHARILPKLRFSAQQVIADECGEDGRRRVSRQQDRAVIIFVRQRGFAKLLQ